ncbi:tyrosine--tRNA ligase [Microbacterium sp. LRZ72]|uniref:tyrosine--tRNA ligase n=1 Tax=Microbacterium sp. LRZ72 TaxID=2942481 RepID=UPI0029AF96AF|nr:tyrosine--tRNA ligase [Microbacterium sp. LRZ72]MDX2375690.1 tyrosine--tRNA ligase [Microbacterium sp. LRZ72]
MPADPAEPELRALAPANDPTFDTIWDELVWRGLVHVSTDADALRTLLGGDPIVYYCGFDPTAPSLHLGNLVQLLVMRRLQLAGHRPLGLVGGSTGLIGDPRPSSERTLNPRETVEEWVAQLRAQIERFLDFGGSNPARMVNNLDWTAPLSAIDFLREIGKHYRVGAMLKKEAVAARLASDAGISYTEFSYQILQGMDYLELYRSYGCVLQTGGSDQWGNLTSGTDLIHRVEGASVHAIGTPLITNSDGSKFGKSEGNAIWLDAAMCSPYRLYQFWLNTGDADVIDRLKVFTFLSRDEIEQYARLVAEEPFRRAAQKRLAHEVTALVHGTDAAAAVIAASEALFGQGDLRALDADVLAQALRELPHAVVASGTPVVHALVEIGLVASASEARRAIAQGGVSVDGARVHDDTAVVTGSLPGAVSVLRRGKKTLGGAFTQA